MKKFAVFDIDGTLIRWQLYHAVVNRLAAAQLLGDHTYDQIRAARLKWKERERPFSEYESTLVRQFLPMLPKLNVQEYERVVREIWDEYHDQTYIYTRNLIKKLRKDGYFLLIISGSPSEIIELLAKYYGFDDFVACVFNRSSDGHFTGAVTQPVHDKKLALQTLVKKHDLDWRGSVAVGDSALDIAMLSQVERPIAFNPDQKLFDAARKQGWQIVVERKDVVYDLLCKERPCKKGRTKYELE